MYGKICNVKVKLWLVIFFQRFLQCYCLPALQKCKLCTCNKIFPLTVIFTKIKVPLQWFLQYHNQSMFVYIYLNFFFHFTAKTLKLKECKYSISVPLVQKWIMCCLIVAVVDFILIIFDLKKTLAKHKNLFTVSQTSTPAKTLCTPYCGVFLIISILWGVMSHG